jgi:hypothetical protein
MRPRQFFRGVLLFDSPVAEIDDEFHQHSPSVAASGRFFEERPSYAAFDRDRTLYEYRDGIRIQYIERSIGSSLRAA